MYEHGLPMVHFTVRVLRRNQTSDLRDSQLMFPTRGVPVSPFKKVFNVFLKE